MKLSKIILMGSFVALGMTSCVSEDLSSEETNKGSGKLTLGVEMLAPSATRAETYTEAPEDFPLEITQGETSIKKYTSWKQFPETGLPMAPGNYTATSHSYGTLKRQMVEPYYVGASSFEIVDQLATEVEVVCKMANGKITLNFGDNFSQKFTSWTLTVDDGEDGALEFTSADNKSGDCIYWRYAENVSELRVNFRGTTSDGVDVSTTQILKKSISESEHYDDDSEYFQGGDCLVLNMNPKATTEGQIIGITLNVDISFADGENDQNVTIDVFGEKQQDGDETENHITVTKPENMKIGDDTDPALGNTYIAAENGIKSIKVSITSNSSDFMDALNDLKSEFHVDFKEGAEIVDNDNVIDVFESVGQELTIPTSGQKEYTFPIGNFFTLLGGMEGVHEFHLEITDMNDCCKAIGTLVIVVGNYDVPATEDMYYSTTQSENPQEVITLNLPDDIIIDPNGEETNPALGDTYIAAENGIASITVSISTENQDFIDAISDLNNEYHVDFMKGAEIVDNNNVIDVFESVGQELTIPTCGQKEYTFPIGNFFTLLGGMSGSHTFNMTVKDMNDVQKSGSITIIVL